MKSLLVISLLFINSQVFAQEDIPAPRLDSSKGFGIIFDQDFFTPQNQDRNYTMGVSINMSGPVFDKNFLLLPALRKGADWLFGIKKWHREGDVYITGMQLFDGAFTPLNIESNRPVRDDRPFGNVLGLASSRTTIINSSENLSKQSSITSRVAVGIIGTRVAEAVQSYIHKKFFDGVRAVPAGWPIQISEGGEPTLLYQLQFMKPVFEQTHMEPRQQMKRMQATWLFEANAGYYTNIASGLSFRIGRFTTPYWKFNNSGMSVASQAPTNIDKKPEFSFFVQFRGRAVLYNALLQGQFKKNDYVLTAGQVNRFLFEAESGLLLNLQKLSIIYQPFIVRTSETALPLTRNHSWGSLAVYYNW